MLVPCPECEKNTSYKAKACPHCGSPMQHWAEANVPQPAVEQVVVANSSNPAIAVLLSIVIPGLGQLYKGQPAIGFVWFFFVVFLYVVNVALGLTAHIACIIGAGTRNKVAPPKVRKAAATPMPATLTEPNPSNSSGLVHRYRYAIAGSLAFVLVMCGSRWSAADTLGVTHHV